MAMSSDVTSSDALGSVDSGSSTLYDQLPASTSDYQNDVISRSVTSSGQGGTGRVENCNSDVEIMTVDIRQNGSRQRRTECCSGRQGHGVARKRTYDPLTCVVCVTVVLFALGAVVLITAACCCWCKFNACVVCDNATVILSNRSSSSSLSHNFSLHPVADNGAVESKLERSVKVNVYGHVVVADSAFDTYVNDDSDHDMFVSDLLRHICLPHVFITHIFQYQLERLMKNCKTGTIQSSRATFNDSNLPLAGSLVEFVMNFSVIVKYDGQRGGDTSRDLGDDVTARVNQLVAEVEGLLTSIEDGQFGLLHLNLNTIAVYSDYHSSEAGIASDNSSIDLSICDHQRQDDVIVWTCNSGDLLNHVIPPMFLQFLTEFYLKSETTSSSDCAKRMSQLICQLHQPTCSTFDEPLMPCRSHCLAVANVCADARLALGVNFELNCSVLPDTNDSNACVGYLSKEEKCQPVEPQVCRQLGFTETAYPNRLGHRSPQEAISDWNKMMYIGTAVKCSDFLTEFSCAAVFPQCHLLSSKGHPKRVIEPCRSLCEAVLYDCGFFINMAGLTAIGELNCSVLPESSDPSVCYGGNLVANSTISGGRQCSDDEFTCKEQNGTRCIRQEWVCDGRIDCENASDEQNCASCGSNARTCRNGWCPPVTAVCDGVVDCRYLEDEYNCLRAVRSKVHATSANNRNESFLQFYNPATSSWSNVCFDEPTLQHFNITSKEQLSVYSIHHSPMPATSVSKTVARSKLTDRHDLMTAIKTRSDCTRFPPVKVSSNLTNCAAQMTSSPLLLEKASSSTTRDLFIEAADWPWMVSLHGGPHQNFFCGASLIDANWLLTAAHCVGGLTEKDLWTVVGGNSRRVSYSLVRQVRSVSHVVVHPDFAAYNMHNDIALLKVDRPFELNSDLQPVCLPHLNYTPSENTKCYVGGWGKKSQKDNRYSRQARLRSLTVFPRISCNRYDMNVVPEYIVGMILDDVNREHRDNLLFCTIGRPGIDVCHGDSGSAVMCEDDVNEYQRRRLLFAGIVSHGFDSDCGTPDIPSAHTAVSSYITWINDVISGDGMTSSSSWSSPLTVNGRRRKRKRRQWL